MVAIKNVLLGRPIHSNQASEERLTKRIALSVFSSDAISSVAYATEEILIVLALAGTAALHLVWPLSIAIAVLLVIVAASYRQTIKAYPNGGGAYIVAKENLGPLPGLVAGGSLLTDYVLTVAVSISSGTAAITSAFPILRSHTVELCVAFVLIIAVGNLRGVRESGNLFAWPTYVFVGTLGTLIVTGLIGFATGHPIHVQNSAAVTMSKDLTIFLLLRAFAAGCSAMTGVEAIANGVRAFKEPEAHNARVTLTWMAGILGFLFLGTGMLAQLSGVGPSSETVISQIARAAWGTSAGYYLLQFATMGVLVLAANTSYADFPRLSSFMASDGYVPRQLKDRGHRLVHSNGIMLLTTVALVLLVVFKGDTHKLIPLYAIGVFTSFTLSQSGMVVHWWRLREPGWRSSMVMNGVGATATLVVLVDIVIAKTTQGAWIVLVLIPLLVGYFLWVHAQYRDVEKRLRLSETERTRIDWQAFNQLHNHVVVLVSRIDRRLVRTLQYAKSLRADSIEAVFVDITGEDGERLRREWDAATFGMRLRVIPSPYRQLVQPLKDYVASIPRPTNDHIVTIVLPEYVPCSLAERMLHDQTPLMIKTALFNQPGVIVTDVPYRSNRDEPCS